MYNNLFRPITINKLEIRNRIAYPSLGLLYSYDRKVNDRYLNFFKEIAAGGAGIVTVGPVGVDYLGSGIATVALDNDEAIPSFKQLADTIRHEGASPWVQLFHGGAYVYPFIIDNKQPMAPSAVFSKYSKTTPKEMTLEDIDTVQGAFVAAALRAREAGFEGVEIIGSAGYLITQFLSPLKNLRTDKYGGSFENRTRFPSELIIRLRDVLGPDFPLTIRMAGNDFVADSTTDAETPKIARIYESCGVDALNVTGGWHEARVPQLPMDLPRGGYAYLAGSIKEMVDIPVMASNRISTPEEAEAIISDGFADMVNLGRVLIADPDWPIKAMNGKSDEIRPCVACSQGCTDEIFSGKPVFCVGNPRAGFEGERIIKKTDKPLNVMVAGGGVAGLEAAVTATRMGHNVELYEKESDIGGQLWIAGTPPHKQELWEFARYYRAMLKKYSIPVFLNTCVDKDLLLEKNPDHVIVAEGAEPLTPPVEGVDDEKVLQAWDVLKDSPKLGKEVAVIGGGAAGLETAMFVASKGTLKPEMLHFLLSYDAAGLERLKQLMFNGTSRVTVFEMLPKAGHNAGKSTKWVLMGNLDKFNVEVNTGCRVVSVDGGRVVFERDGKPEHKSFDQVILASGSRSVKRLTTEVEKMGVPYTPVGDTIEPGKLNDAIHGGFLAALQLDGC